MMTPDTCLTIDNHVIFLGIGFECDVYCAERSGSPRDLRNHSGRSLLAQLVLHSVGESAQKAELR